MLSEEFVAYLGLAMWFLSCLFAIAFCVFGVIFAVRELRRKEEKRYAKKNDSTSDDQEDESGQYF